MQAVAGLELLSWYGLLYWTNPAACLEKDFQEGGLSWDKKVRRLLAACEIEAPIPGGLAESRSFMDGRHDARNGDGPEFIAWVRNSIVHPIPRISPTHRMLVEAHQLAVEYMKLVLLRFLDYDGRFVNRVLWLSRTGSPGQNEVVPWAQ